MANSFEDIEVDQLIDLHCLYCDESLVTAKQGWLNEVEGLECRICGGWYSIDLVMNLSPFSNPG